MSLPSLPPLNITEQVTHVIDYGDLENFVNAVYGFEATAPYRDSNYKQFPYNFVATEECSNDSSHEFYITGELDEVDIVEHDQWVTAGGKGWCSNRNVLNDLCRMGYLEKGDYIVRVCW